MFVLNEDKTVSRLTVVGALGGNYIFKPPSKFYFLSSSCLLVILNLFRGLIIKTQQQKVESQ
jgi:hypothetical protein